jgi:hypothetical protein
LWIDLKTKLPVKRQYAFTENGETVRSFEIYASLTVDGKLDAKTFDLPK